MELKPVYSAALTGVCLLAAGCAQTAPEERKMNVIYILADDLGYGDLGCTGQTKFATPNIDRLRAEGMLFTQHYSGCTVSAPSRSSLMTGQHTGHTFIRGNMKAQGQPEGQAPLPGDTYTLGKMFHAAGYQTACAGKWGLGYPGSEGDPNNLGFDDFFGYNCQSLAHRYYPAHLWHNQQKVVLEGNADGRRGDYAPDIIQEHALEWISSNKDKPFFFFYAAILPHAELLVPEDSVIDGFRGKFDEVPYKAKEKDEYGPSMTTDGYCSQAEPYATFASMVTRLDNYVGEIVELLKKQGLDKNTIIMFSSDNGPHHEGGANPDFFDSYGPFRGVKRDVYEGGIRLPLIAWAPGRIEAGSSSDHICAMWDMMPTLSQIAGVDSLPEGVETDGISITPTLFGNDGQAEHDYLYWEFHEMKGKQAVRMGNWKGVLLNVTDPDKRKFELYDLSQDISEQNNVADQFPEISEKIQQIIIDAATPSELFPFKTQQGRM